jgi:F-type H+-transporting ATPase subunit delta
VEVTEPVSISSGIASRYATAVFELAREGNALDALDADIAALEQALAVSDEFRAVIASPIVSRDDQGRAVAALAAKLGLGATMANTLALMASKRRLFVLPQLLAALRARLAVARGEVTAEVTAARALSPAQSQRLAQTLKGAIGKDVKIRLAVDSELIGGLVVKVGSQMIDSSIRSKLANLKNAMKEVR